MVGVVAPAVGRRRLKVNAGSVLVPREEEPTILMAMEDITSESLVHEQQQRLIRQLSAPVLPLQKQILVVPIIGPLNSERMRQVKEKLLEFIRQRRTRIVILDLTGAAIENEDEEVVKSFSDITKASKLVGTIAILTGISSVIA